MADPIKYSTTTPSGTRAPRTSQQHLPTQTQHSEQQQHTQQQQSQQYSCNTAESIDSFIADLFYGIVAKPGEARPRMPPYLGSFGTGADLLARACTKQMRDGLGGWRVWKGG